MVWRTRVVRPAVVVAVLAVAAVVGALVWDQGGPEPAGVPAADQVSVEGKGSGLDGDGVVGAEAATVPGMPDIAPTPGGVPVAPTPGGVPVAPDVAARELVRSAQMVLDVPDPAAAVRAIRTAAAVSSAVVAQEQSGTDGGFVVLRVPAADLDRLTDAVGELGTVVSRGSQLEDVTGQVVDLDARLASQQASVERVRGLLAQATSIGDVVLVESELARREADLDALRAGLTSLRDQVALATLTVELRPGAEAGGGGFGDGLAGGWAGLRGLASALATAAGFAVPFLPVAALVVGGAWWWRSHWGKGARRGKGRSGPGPDGES